jgi:hypothetical protein
MINQLLVPYEFTAAESACINNADSNWKDLDQAYESLNTNGSLIEVRFRSIQEAKKALNNFIKDKSVQSLHLEMVDLSELIHP